MKPIMTICWDCAKATGGCSWADKFKPVKGWKAQELPPTSTRSYTTYIISECPEFKRDAYNNGLKRFPPQENK